MLCERIYVCPGRGEEAVSAKEIRRCDLQEGNKQAQLGGLDVESVEGESWGIEVNKCHADTAMVELQLGPHLPDQEATRLKRESAATSRIAGADDVVSADIIARGMDTVVSKFFELCDIGIDAVVFFSYVKGVK